MGNSFITNTARYQPFSYEELVKPIEHIQQLHDQTDQFYQAAGMQAQNIATSLGDDNPIAMEMYNTFNTALNAASDDLLKNGYNPSTTKKLMGDARNSYITNMLPINKAIASRQEDAKRALEFQKAHPNSVFSSLSNVDAYLQGTNKPLGMVNMDDVYKKAMEAAKAISERTYTNGTTKSNVAGYIATYMQQGFTSEQAMQAAYNATDEKGNPLFPEFAVATANILNSTDYNTLDASGQSKVMSALSNGFNAGIMRKLDIDYHKNWIAEQRMRSRNSGSGDGISAQPNTIPYTLSAGQPSTKSKEYTKNIKNLTTLSTGNVTVDTYNGGYQGGSTNISFLKDVKAPYKNPNYVPSVFGVKTPQPNTSKMVMTEDEFVSKYKGVSQNWNEKYLRKVYKENITNNGYNGGDFFDPTVASKHMDVIKNTGGHTDIQLNAVAYKPSEVNDILSALKPFLGRQKKSGKTSQKGDYYSTAKVKRVTTWDRGANMTFDKNPVSIEELGEDVEKVIGYAPTAKVGGRNAGGLFIQTGSGLYYLDPSVLDNSTSSMLQTSIDNYTYFGQQFLNSGNMEDYNTAVENFGNIGSTINNGLRRFNAPTGTNSVKID